MSEKLTIDEIKERLEKALPDLIVGRDTETNRLQIISKRSWQVVAYAYHKKFVLKPAISDYSIHIAAIIGLLEQWDEVSNE